MEGLSVDFPAIGWISIKISKKSKSELDRKSEVKFCGVWEKLSLELHKK
jgi:hypothetical protein